MKRTSKAKTCQSCPVEGSIKQHIAVAARNGECIEEYTNLLRHQSRSANTSTYRQKYSLVKEMPLELQYGLDYEECIPVSYNSPQSNQQMKDIPIQDVQGKNHINGVHNEEYITVCNVLNSEQENNSPRNIQSIRGYMDWLTHARSFRVCVQLMFYLASIAIAVCVLLTCLEIHQRSYPALSYIKSKSHTSIKNKMEYNSKESMEKFRCNEYHNSEDVPKDGKVDLHHLLNRIEELIESNARLQVEAASFKQQHNALKETVLQMKSSVDSLKGKEGTLTKSSQEVKFQEENIERLFREISSYDADKLGLPDFALESSGGRIVSTPDTKTVSLNAWFTVWGFPLWNINKSPRNVIQASVVPGDCWAFHGSSGKVVIKLALPVLIGAVTIEHIPASIALTGKIDSAPRLFTVIGLQEPDDIKGVGLGYYTYSAKGTPRQTFPITKQGAESAVLFKAVILWILSNHGHPDYTCIYRFRVHGHLHTMEGSKTNS